MLQRSQKVQWKKEVVQSICSFIVKNYTIWPQNTRHNIQEKLIIEEPSFGVYIIKIITTIWCRFSQPFLWDWAPIIPKMRLFSQDDLSITADASWALGPTLPWFSPDKRTDIQGHTCWVIDSLLRSMRLPTYVVFFLWGPWQQISGSPSCVHCECQSWTHVPLCLDSWNSRHCSCNFVAGIYRINLVC